MSIQNTSQNEKKFSNDEAVYLDLYKKLKEKNGGKSVSLFSNQKIERVDFAAEEQHIKNEGLRQDIEMKKKTLDKLFKFLTYETIAIFLFAFLQAIHWFGFGLEEWSFKLLLTATISQITVMLIIAVKHLFPNSKKEE